MQTSDSHSPHQSGWKAVAGALILLLVFALAVKLLVGMAPSATDEDAGRIAERSKAREELDAENKQKLETYGWADKTKGTVQIPIQQAMELTLKEMSGRQPSMAGPIVVTPPPAPAPAPAAPGTTP